MLQEFFALRITILIILKFHVALPSKVSNKYVETSLKLMVIKFLEYDSICQGESDLIPTSVDEIFVSTCWRRAV